MGRRKKTYLDHERVRVKHAVYGPLAPQHSQILESGLMDFLTPSRVLQAAKLDEGVAGATFGVLSEIVGEWLGGSEERSVE